MKKFILAIFVSAALLSCKKNVTPTPEPTPDPGSTQTTTPPPPATTDALTKAQVDTLAKRLTQYDFHDVADSTRANGKDTAWTATTLGSFPQSIHFRYTVTSTDNNIISGNYQQITNSNNAVNASGTFLISANGKTITITTDAAVKTLSIVELTAARFEYIVFNYSVGVDYKFVATKY
jgi:hypothetical protein